jgi:hypothetical protein
MLMRMIPTKAHAMMDYVVGVLLIAAPWIFQYSDESSAAKWISIVAGLAIIGMSAITDYEGGFVARLVPMRTHLMSDAVLGVFLAISPWLFGFGDRGANAWAPFVVIGLGEIAAAATTDPVPAEHGAGRRQAHRTA